MAKVVGPAMSIEARGKVGAFIYNTWRGLSTVKAFRAPTQPQTAAQLEIRGYLTQLSQSWSALTSAQRAAWKQYADDHPLTDWTGKPKRATGQNWYIALNVRILMVAGTVIDEPPVSAAPAAPTGLVISYVAGPPEYINMAWTGPTGATDFLVVFKVGPISAGRTPRRELAAIVATQAGDGTSPIHLATDPSAGKYGYWVYALDSLTGLVSQELYQEVTAS